MNATFVITNAEAGQKLLQCLARRTGQNPSVLHRWIRTGQVRVNGGRCKPFDRIELGDEIRLPPFANVIQGNDDNVQQIQDFSPKKFDTSCSVKVPIIFQSSDLIVVNKPAGLPTQGGSGHTEAEGSVVDILRTQFSHTSFAPTPAHRLDIDTSGILLVATSYSSLRYLSNLFASHTKIAKEYLAWCVGVWNTTETLCDCIAKTKDEHGCERVTPTSDGKNAVLDIHPLCVRNNATLVHIRLQTGRMHQIRIQLASRGHPIIGDGKYGGRLAFATQEPPQHLLLHSCRIMYDEHTFEALPPWKGVWSVKALPPAMYSL